MGQAKDSPFVTVITHRLVFPNMKADLSLRPLHTHAHTQLR